MAYSTGHAPSLNLFWCYADLGDRSAVSALTVLTCTLPVVQARTRTTTSSSRSSWAVAQTHKPRSQVSEQGRAGL